MSLDARLNRCRRSHREQEDRFEEVRLRALSELLEVILPDLSAKSVERAAQKVGVTLDPDMADSLAGERRQIESRLAEIESDPRYLEREALLCPDTGEIGSALAQFQEHRKALEPVLKICFKHPRFLELLESGFGTKKYNKPFWRLAYHVDRQAAREIEEACGGKDFAKIRRDVVSAMDASKVLDQRIASLQQRREEIEQLCRERSRLRSRLKRLEEIWLGSARWRIRRVLEKDPEGQFKRLQDCSEWLEALLRWRTHDELCKEFKRLKLELLVEAEKALEEGEETRAGSLLDEFEKRTNSLTRFLRPPTQKSEIDWQKLFYG